MAVGPFMDKEDSTPFSQSLLATFGPDPLSTVCDPTASHRVLHAWRVLIFLAHLIR